MSGSPAPPPKSPTRAPRRFAALAGLSLLLFLATAGTFASLGVALPDMVASQHWSWTQAGLGFTLLGVACGLTSLAPAAVIRTLGVRVTLMCGGALMAAGFVCLAMTRGVGLYWAGAVLLGFGFSFAALIPGTFVLARRFAQPARAFGAYYMAGGLGGVAGPLLYGPIAGPGRDWRAYWCVLAVALLGSAILAAMAIGRVEPASAAREAPSTAEGWTVSAALRTPQFWIVTLAYSTYLLAETTVSSLSVKHLTEHGVGFALAAGLLSAQALLNAVSRAVGGALGDRLGERRLAVGALASMAVGMAALATARAWPGFLVYVLGVGLGYGVSFLATTVLLLQWFGRRRNLELFSIMCLVSTLAALGPLAGGWAHDRTGSFQPVIWACAGLALVFAAALALVRPPRSV